MINTKKELFEQTWYNFFKNNNILQSQWTTNNFQFTNYKVFSEYFKTNNLDLIIQSGSDGNQVKTNVSMLNNQDHFSFSQIKENTFWNGGDPDASLRQSLNSNVGNYKSLQDYLDINNIENNITDKSKENAIIVAHEANKLIDSLNLYLENTDISINMKKDMSDKSIDSYINGLLNSKSRISKGWKNVINDAIETASNSLLNFNYFNTLHYPYLLKTSIPFEKTINEQSVLSSLNIDVHPHEVLGLDNKANIQNNIFFAFRKPITTDVIIKLENEGFLSAKQIKDLKRFYIYNSNKNYGKGDNYNTNPMDINNRYNTFDDEKHSLIFVLFLNYETNKLEVSVYYSDSYLVNLNQVLSYFNKEGTLVTHSNEILKELVSFNLDLNKNKLRMSFIPIFKYSLFSNNNSYYDYSFPMYTIGTLNLDFTSNKLKIQDTIENVQQFNILALAKDISTLNGNTEVVSKPTIETHANGDTKIIGINKELVKDLNNNGRYIPPSETLGFLQLLIQGEEKLRLDMESSLNFTIPRFGLNTIAPDNKSFYDNIIGVTNIVKTALYQSLFVAWLANADLRQDISFEQLNKISNLLKIVILTPDQKDKNNEQQLDAIKSGASSKNDLGKISEVIKEVQLKNRN